MTTVVGISHENPNVALLAADRQGTIILEGRAQEKSMGHRKLFLDKEGNYALGHSGAYDDKTAELIEKVQSGKIDMRKVVTDGKFEELRELNLGRLGRKIPDLERMSSFLLVSRYDGKTKLQTCWPLGDVEDRGLTYIGSGSPRAAEYFNARKTLSQTRNYRRLKNDHTEVADIIIAGLEAVRYAQMIDIHSSGLDLVVATPDGLRDHETALSDDFFGRKLKAICKLYKTATK